MAKLTLFLIFGLVAVVLAKPHEIDREYASPQVVQNQPRSNSYSIFDSDKLSEEYLIQLYERLLQVRPAVRPEVNDQPKEQPREDPKDSLQTDEFIAESSNHGDVLLEKQPEELGSNQSPSEREPEDAKPSKDVPLGDEEREENESKLEEPLEKGSEAEQKQEPQDNRNGSKTDEVEEKRDPKVAPQKPNVPQYQSREHGQRELPRIEDGAIEQRKGKPANGQGQGSPKPSVPQKPEVRMAPVVQINLNVAPAN